MKTRFGQKAAKFATIVMAGICSIFAANVYADGVEDGEQDNDGITAIAESPSITGKSKIVLTVDQYGNPSSTNALATSADLAAVAASNQLAVAVQQANNDGYTQATNLLNEVAEAVVQAPVIFCSVELTSFIAATVFDEATAKLRVFQWDINVSTNKVINGYNCNMITCGYMFNSNIDSLEPMLKYTEVLYGETPTNQWGYLSAAFIESAVPVQHASYTAADGTVFTDFYQMKIWVPEERMAGFFRVVVENSSIPGEGNTLDTVGVVDGYTGLVTIGNINLNIKGGYILTEGTGTTSP